MFSVKSAVLAVGLLLPSEALAATRRYHWSMTYEGLPSQPDKMVVLINGKWPPEAVEAEVDDTIIIDVDNVNVKDGVSLHAHGFHQTNRNHEDGPVGVTQCAIEVGASQRYTWIAEQVGTFWVHSHVPGQYPEGLRSPLIIRSSEEPEYYGYDKDADLVMDVADNWYKSIADVEDYFKTGACCFDKDRGGICGMEVPPDNALVRDDLSGVTTYKAPADRRMRVRIINMSMSSTFIVFANDPSIDMYVTENDGVALKAKEAPVAKSLTVRPGQRYSVLIKADKNFLLHSVVDPDQYSGNTCQQLNPFPDSSSNGAKAITHGHGWIQARRNKDSAKTATGWQYALMATAQFDLGSGDMPVPYFKPFEDYCQDSTKPCFVRYVDDSRQSLTNLPEHAEDESLRLNDMWAVDGHLHPRVDVPRIQFDENSVILHVRLTARPGKVRFADLNDKAWSVPQVPILLKETQPKAECEPPIHWVNGQEADHYFEANSTWYVKRDTKVFIVVGSETGPHPFHLHGYDFQVLYMGKEDKSLPPKDRNKQDDIKWPDEEEIRSNRLKAPALPDRRDTLEIGAKQYAILAIEATNPGSWFLHCHNDFHAITGMAGTMVVDSPNTADWNNAVVGQKIWDQCGFKTLSGGGYEDWVAPCCVEPETCPNGPAVV